MQVRGIGSVTRRWFGGTEASGTTVGVHFGHRSAALVRLRAIGPGGRPELEFVQRLAADPTRRADIVRRWSHAGRLRDARVLVSLAAGEYDLHQVQAPPVPADELRDALRWQLRGVLTYPPEDAALDFVRVPAPEVAPGRAALLAITALKSNVNDAVAPLADAGVAIEAVDVPELGQRNLALLAGAGEGSCAVVSFDEESCLLTVQVGVDLAFARRIQVNGMTLETSLETDHAIQYLADRVVTHVQRSLDLYERQSGLPAVSRLLVAPHRHAGMFVQQLTMRAGVVAEALEPNALLERGPDIPLESPEWHPESLAALGAALRVSELQQQRGSRAKLPRLARWFGRGRAQHEAPTESPAAAQA
jgi:MSHA biogenesis protein MshI